MALGPKTIERIVELEAGWSPIVASPDELANGVQLLRAARSEAGLNPDSLEVRAAAPGVRGSDGRPDLDATLSGLSSLAEMGVTVASFALAAFARSAEDVRPFLERLGKAASTA